MDVAFEPQKIVLTIGITPAEAKQILVDFPPVSYELDRPISRLLHAIRTISLMSTDELIKEMNTDYSEPLPPGVVRGSAGQRHASRP